MTENAGYGMSSQVEVFKILWNAPLALSALP